jgi:transposase
LEIIAEIRRRHFISNESVSSLARSLKLTRNTVRKYLHATAGSSYQRTTQPEPKLGAFKQRLLQWLEHDAGLPKKQRRTARRLYEGLVGEGYPGAYDSVQRYVKQWKTEAGRSSTSQAFVPLAFAPGEVCQFDWSEETAEIDGIVQRIKLAHFRLAYSRKLFVVAYPCETQEMVLDAHVRAFAFFGGVPQQMVYDNLTTVVQKTCFGQQRQFNRRFLALANHYLFEPVACTPAAGWEKGQVENQVARVRSWLFTPLVRAASFEDLNTWLSERCHELAQRLHPTQLSRTIGECFSDEQPLLRVIDAPFDGYVEHHKRVSSTCLILLDRNRYSVPAEWAGRPVSVRLSATEVVVLGESQVLARHRRVFGRDQLLCDPWHYLPVLEKKPGALRHGAPFQDWDLPLPIQQVRSRLAKQPGGDRAFVDLLLLARQLGLETLEVACEMTLHSGVIQGSVLLNTMRRLSEPSRPKPLDGALDQALNDAPGADYQRYDHLMGGQYVH